MIMVPKEDDECTSGVLDKTMFGTKDATQRFDVASESAMIAMGYDTGKFSPCLYQWRAREYNKRSLRDHAKHWETSQRSGH